jgi:hypothetical protein
MDDVREVHRLLEQGADANSNRDPVINSGSQSFVEQLHLIFAHRRGDHFPLTVAAANGNQEIVRDLLHHGAAIDASDSDGITALSSAARRCHVDMVRLLLIDGADPNAPDNDGKPLLSYAFPVEPGDQPAADGTARGGLQIVRYLTLASGKILSLGEIQGAGYLFDSPWTAANLARFRAMGHGAAGNVSGSTAPSWLPSWVGK